MSSFKETFTRSKKSNVLGYDDSAFLFFSGCLFLTFLLPLTIVWLNRVKSVIKLRSDDNKKSVKTYDRKEFDFNVLSCQSDNSSKATKLKNKIFSTSFLQFTVLVTLWIILIKIIFVLSSTKEIQTFNPYEILDVSVYATGNDIRKAYRELSRKYHPDRNPNDPQSTARFILISKAYNALTDEVSKSNYAKYGNPDGPGSFQIGIGLPRFFVEEKYQFSVLLLLVIVLALIPSMFIYHHYYQNQKLRKKIYKFFITVIEANGVQTKTFQDMAQKLTEGSRVKSFIPIISESVEACENVSIKLDDDQYMNNLMKVITFPLKKNVNADPVVIRNNILLLAHLERKHHMFSPSLLTCLKYLLQVSDLVTECMIHYAFFKNWFFTLMAIIDFRRRLIQALAFNQNESLLQLPHFDEHNIKSYLKNRKAARNLKGFVQQYSTIEANLSIFDENQRADINYFCSKVPLLSITAYAFVANETDIYENDLITISVEVDRLNLDKDEVTEPFKFPYYPIKKIQKLDKLINYAQSVNPNKKFVQSLHTTVPIKGKYTYVLSVMSDEYIDVDVETDINFNVLVNPTGSSVTSVHPDDADLDNVKNYMDSYYMADKELENEYSTDSDE